MQSKMLVKKMTLGRAYVNALFNTEIKLSTPPYEPNKSTNALKTQNHKRKTLTQIAKTTTQDNPKSPA